MVVAMEAGPVHKEGNSRSGYNVRKPNLLRKREYDSGMKMLYSPYF